MPRFFVEKSQINDGTVTVFGDDAHHLSRSLRMAAGEEITVCDGEGREYLCRLTEFLPDRVIAEIEKEMPCNTEPAYVAHVFQALPKGEKLDMVIQKAVECGASEITVFESERCVVRMKEEGESKKLERRRRIALEAAKQCGRGRVPIVHPTVTFRQALATASGADLALFCYEGEGTEPLARILERFSASNRVGEDGKIPNVSIMIGSEGGFSPREAEEARRAGMVPVGLGSRILRTETAATFVLACLVYAMEMK